MPAITESNSPVMSGKSDPYQSSQIKNELLESEPSSYDSLPLLATKDSIYFKQAERGHGRNPTMENKTQKRPKHNQG